MKKQIGVTATLVVTAAMVGYPILWLIMASFKGNAEIFASAGLIPKAFTLDGYILGFRGTAQSAFSLFLANSIKLVLPTSFLTICSACLVAYGFSRFAFPMKKLWFSLMISTMMLPNTIIMIPRYILFMDFGWLNSYVPFYMLGALATNPFFAYLLIQFFRGIPAQLDESAYIDGCGRGKILFSIILPLAKTPIISAGLFQFMWTWNDFFNPLIYIDSVKLYPVALGLRLAIDGDSAVNWNKIIAMAVLSMLPCILLFLFLQRYFVEGIATTGIKG